MSIDNTREGRTPVRIELGEALDTGSLREAVKMAMAEVSYFGGVTPEEIADREISVADTNRMAFEGALMRHGLDGTVSEGVLTIVRSDATLAAELSPVYDQYGHEEKGPKGERVIRDYEI